MQLQLLSIELIVNQLTNVVKLLSRRLLNKLTTVLAHDALHLCNEFVVIILYIAVDIMTNRLVRPNAHRLISLISFKQLRFSIIEGQ